MLGNSPFSVINQKGEYFTTATEVKLKKARPWSSSLCGISQLKHLQLHNIHLSQLTENYFQTSAQGKQ